MQESKLIHDLLRLGKTLTLHNVMILIMSVFDKNQNHYYYYYYSVFLGKCSDQLD